MVLGVLRGEFHKLSYDLAPLVTKRPNSSMFTGGFWCLFTAKKKENGRWKYFEFAVLPL